MKIKHLVRSFALCLFLSACFGEPQQIISTHPDIKSSDSKWPTREWQASSLREQGLDPVLFEDMQAYIEQSQIKLHSLLVVRHGYLVFEEYYGDYTSDTLHTQYSCTKSVVSTLVGIAIDQGYISGVDEPVVRLLPNRQMINVDERKSRITLENILTMSAGIAWQEHDPGFEGLFMSPDWVQHMLEKPMAAEPGQNFLYCSGCSHLLTGVLAEATGEDVVKFADDHLFKPLGITHYSWDTDPQGIPSGGWGIQMTPRDMAKLGFLYLNRGQWDGKQIVSENWVDQASTPQIDTGEKLGYGYQWWTYPSYGAYTALGRYGQVIFVVPDFDLVIVTTARIENHDVLFDLIDRFIIPAVLSSDETKG